MDDETVFPLYLTKNEMETLMKDLNNLCLSNLTPRPAIRLKISEMLTEMGVDKFLEDTY